MSMSMLPCCVCVSCVCVCVCACVIAASGACPGRGYGKGGGGMCMQACGPLGRHRRTADACLLCGARDPAPISRVSSPVVCGCVDLGGLAAPVPWRPPASARAVPQRPACERQRSNARPACPVAAPPLSRTTMAHGQLRGARATGVGVTSSQGVGVTSSCSACPREGARVRGQNYTGLPVRRTGDKGRCDI